MTTSYFFSTRGDPTVPFPEPRWRLHLIFRSDAVQCLSGQGLRGAFALVAMDE